MRIILFIFISMTILSGCAMNMTMPEPVEPAPQNFVIRSIDIKPEVIITDKPFVQTPGMLWGGAIGGLIGAAIAGEGKEEQFISLLKNNDIDLKKIFVNKFKDRLNSSNTPIKLTSQNADVKLEFIILYYGIHPSAPFSSDMEPMLEVGAKIIDKRGKHIRNISESFKFPDDDQVTPYPMEQYTASPNLLKEGFEKLSALIADELIKQLSSPPV